MLHTLAVLHSFPLLTGKFNNILILIVPCFILIEAIEYEAYCIVRGNQHYSFPVFPSDIGVITLLISS